MLPTLSLVFERFLNQRFKQLIQTNCAVNSMVVELTDQPELKSFFVVTNCTPS